MAQLFPYVRGIDNEMYFNISADVGPHCPNKREDVEMVQFGYYAASLSPYVKSDLKPIFAKVVPGSQYTGAANDPLTIAIAAHEHSHGGTQDGRISRIGGPGYYKSGGEGLIVNLMIALSNSMRDLMPGEYPRIDKHPKCPPGLASSVRKSFQFK